LAISAHPLESSEGVQTTTSVGVYRFSMSRRAVTFDISPVGSVEKRGEILRSAALRRGRFEQKACCVKSSGRKSAFGTFRGGGQK
jgi:hypothetical protein